MVPLNLRINSDFFEDEIRCDYLVTKSRKEIWAVELDLLHQFDLLCRKYDLKYCVGAGTMLGAIRHQGFIPWDDDMDLYMLRSDFDLLISHADDFEQPYFLQNGKTEPNLLRTFARLRNSATTGATIREEDSPINKGVFIDIFPLDGVEPNTVKNTCQTISNRIYKDIAGCFNYSRVDLSKYAGREKAKRKGYRIISDMLIRNKEDFFDRFENNLKKYSNSDTAVWGNRTLVFDCPKSRRPRSDYEDLIYMPFEMLQVPVPRNYDSMLRQQYGDYMKIPEIKGQNMHGELIISTNYAYDDPRRLTEK